uniref:Cotton fiber protein n=1 Tax=Davidia involucrata TaxID=16924 RepID=A0A5B7BHT9_DAVIN
MPRKRSPIFQKVSSLLKFSILIAKMRKPIIPKLIFLKKSSNKLKKFKLLKHYNYGYLQEYQFSPSSTPLIHYYHRQPFKKSSYRDMFSMFFLCRCLGRLRSAEGGEGDYPLPLEGLPAIEDEVARELSELSGYSSHEEDSVDERADRFIERFYEEMRMQRQESVLQLMDC